MKQKTQVFLLAGLITVLFASCAKPVEAPKPLDLDKLKTEIQKMEDDFAAAEKAKDAAAVAMYYAEDAVSYSRNQEPSVGRAAIQAQIAKNIVSDSTGNYNVYKLVDLFAEGNMAVEIGSWTVIDTAGVEGKKGFYLSYFQKRDGKYVCVRDMNVSTSPEKK